MKWRDAQSPTSEPCWNPDSQHTSGPLGRAGLVSDPVGSVWEGQASLSACSLSDTDGSAQAQTPGAVPFFSPQRWKPGTTTQRRHHET